MGKISKYSNLYDKNGEFLHGPGKWTVPEMELLLEKFPKYSVEWTNITRLLMQSKDFSFDDKTVQKLLGRDNQTTKEEVINAIKDASDEIGTNTHGSGNETEDGGNIQQVA